ncbi:MAG TPA: 16S rRNA (cytosine(1402)-N(4))-methyltransferase RsmH [Cyclobacteriaceae bacterium]|nr:16S rRNA (cytosine(1402)-N(4))-methyltransferase RsmH [Cyclobacteriaceae bacterium]HPW63763.1 16S rRNA (cytosine(1402)-N(4))-methyltransferase RsmH [Cyclobacteriaceae bacterium]
MSNTTRIQNPESGNYHKPVMLTECIEALCIKPEGIYVDVTFGGGGHSMVILENLREGRLIAFDQDEDAKRQADNIQSRSFTFCQANFRYMKQYLKLNGVTQVDGILADLGISSHQIDSPERGFSTRFEGPLDMRMDQKGSITAAKILNEYPEADLHKIFGMYGELKNARTAAKAVIAARSLKPLSTTLDLKVALQQITPRGKENKYFAQVFQALRIEVNEEMKALEDFLHQCGEVMKQGGRLVIMSYHSLEDRMVKNYINTGKVFGELEKDFYGNPIKPFQAVNRKPIEASEEEVNENRRARSAKLRVATKI